MLNFKYRVYDLSGTILFETTFRKDVLDNYNVTKIDYKNNHLYIATISAGRIFNLKK